MASPLKLLRESGLIRHNLIAFAILTAAINGLVTASVGAWLAHAYANNQSRRESVQGLADLIYERRTRGGLVVSSLRRGADLEELRYRKRAYDDVYVEWNKRIQTNLLQIRELIGAREANAFEGLMQDGLVPALTAMDGCLTKGYDVRIAGQDPVAIVDGCQYQMLHQFSLDCAKAMTDELHRLTRMSVLPFSGASRREIAESGARAESACRVPPLPLAAPPASTPGSK